MAQYIDLRAKPSGAVNYVLVLRIRNTDQTPLTANWKVTLPDGIAEQGERRLLVGEKVVPPGRAVEVGQWQVVVASPGVFFNRKIQVVVHIAISTHLFTEMLEETIGEIRDL